jgi:hypothetical protein
VFLLFQETVGKSLEEMNDVFDNQSIWAYKVKTKTSGFQTRLETIRREVEKGEGLEHEELQVEGKTV